MPITPEQSPTREELDEEKEPAPVISLAKARRRVGKAIAEEQLKSFKATMAALTDSPSESEWKAATRSYRKLRDALKEHEGKWSQLWTKVDAAQKALRAGEPGAEQNPFLVFDKYARIRTKRYQQSEAYKEKRRSYQQRPDVQARDRERAKDPKRQQQIREAQKRHRAKQRRASQQHQGEDR